MEEDSKKRTRRANLKAAILGVVQFAGIITVAALAPNVIGALDKLGALPSPRRQESIRNARNRLIRQGYLVSRDGKLHLTNKGERELRKFGIVPTAERQTKRWDGKWRVLIFDIPDHRKGVRDSLRRSLIAYGFIRLQDSVWIYPFNCEDYVALLKSDLRIGKDIQYVIADSIEEDNWLRGHFGML